MKLIMGPPWDTSASGNDTQPLPSDFDDLGEHAHECDAANGKWFGALRRMDALQAFLAPRPISVLTVVLAFSMTVLGVW